MIASDRFEHVEVRSATELRTWLAANHQCDEGVWLVTWKKIVPENHIGHEAVLDELLCFGWTDGVLRKIDSERVMQLISPRREDRWAQSYKDRAARLIAETRMRPPGLEVIDRSMAASLWDAMALVDALVVPPDLVTALRATPTGSDRWESLPPSYRRNVLRWIGLSKTSFTRSRRVEQAAQSTDGDKRIPQM